MTANEPDRPGWTVIARIIICLSCVEGVPVLLLMVLRSVAMSVLQRHAGGQDPRSAAHDLRWTSCHSVRTGMVMPAAAGWEPIEGPRPAGGARRLSCGCFPRCDDPVAAECVAVALQAQQSQ